MPSADDTGRPSLPDYVRLRLDPVRRRPVLLAPERNVFLDETAFDVLRLCDGSRSIDMIAAELADLYDASAAEIRQDVAALLDELATDRLLNYVDSELPAPGNPIPDSPKAVSSPASAAPIPGETEPPTGLLAELTHRCPLQCLYCSNPSQLTPRRDELDTETWNRVMREAAALGVLQVHFSGGEPTTRHDLEDIVRSAAEAGLYTNLITAGVSLPAPRLKRLKDAGLLHVQVSLQAADEAASRWVTNFPDAVAMKRATADRVRSLGLALTINAPVHARNLDRLEELIELSVAVGAQRLEVAHVQYYGWALANRHHLSPSPDQVRRSLV
jgi:PqqA peptide cyclase